MRARTLQTWNAQATDACLSPSEVHVWRAHLDQPEACRQNLASLLSQEEQERAESFLLPRDRHRFLVGRGLLRTLLGRYLQASPQELEFTYSPHGKPSVGGSVQENALEFNLAHSGGGVLYAVALGRRVGVDIERIRSDRSCAQIADRFFASAEKAALNALNEAERLEAFYTYWTCKEAYTKATGRGLSCPLDSFAIRLTSGESATLLHIGGDSSEIDRWSFCELGAFPGYADALVTEGHDWVLRCWEWVPDTS